MQRVHDNGHVYKGTYEGLVLPALRGLQDRERDRPGQDVPDPQDPARAPEARRTGSSSSRAFQEPLERLYAEQPDFVRPRTRYNEALVVHHGRPERRLRSAARKLTWGVEVPWDTEHVFYVWFDALLNYYTALSFAAPART